MRTIVKCIFSIMLTITSNFAYSDQAFQTGKVSWLLIHNNPDQTKITDKRVLIRLEGSKTSGFCSDTWTILLSNKAAEVQYSTLLAAYMAGKTVKLTGNPSKLCQGNEEVVRNVELN
ncbi:hypothetical protein [Vibrio sagamiensis]|uniref:Uncharacterized protein n=1 Tax=Vibrio sagamiensis NBRC 104589 TaxID=1219064 RepID=A0A511QKB1_9VIBR|nr:hypothetical protein [Vibrio sagamiensis]GEM77721.1 hypothetical protein VSA01S_38330 [Vibrio sagamiensis NBRC 104589]